MEEWIPLLQTLVWPVVLVGLVIAFRGQLRQVVEAVRARIAEGADVEVSAAGFSARIEQQHGELPAVAPEKPGPQAPPAPQGPSDEPGEPHGWPSGDREALLEGTRRVFLAHVITPSTAPGQKFEVYVYLVGHQRGRHGLPEDLSDVVRAEFDLGAKWGRVFDVPIRPGAQIGMRTHAYGPAVCLCRVTFGDGHRAVLDRRLDFEMGGVFDPAP
ncbi:hypothetical protein [Cellulomonas sp. URHB0016]